MDSDAPAGISNVEPVAPLYAGELSELLRTYATQYQASLSESGLDSVLRVRAFARAAGIELGQASAASEALQYIKNTVSNRYYILWLDLSICKNHQRAQQRITSYVQAMRTAVSRLRNIIRQTGQSRSLRKWGITVIEVIELAECPGLWRVVLDNRRNITRERFIRILADTHVYDGLTVAGTAATDGGTEVEQEAELRRRGIDV